MSFINRCIHALLLRGIILSLSIFFLPIILTASILARFCNGKRQGNPRLVWGPIPIISIKFISRALTPRGFQCTTVVDKVYLINKASDFDVHYRRFIWHKVFGTGRINNTLSDFINPYLVFIWTLFSFDIYTFFFSGGFLYSTNLRFLEAQFLKLANKKLLMLWYGSDVIQVKNIASHSLLLKAAYLKNYPRKFLMDADISKKIRYFCKWADWVVTSGLHGLFHVPRGDTILCSYFIHDSSETNAVPEKRTDNTVRILHAPNHRAIKGTAFLVKAVERLKKEGLDVELSILEKVPNEAVLQAIANSDIVADQFIGGWYAQFAIEGMAAGKPVLGYLRKDALTIHFDSPDECPIVNTEPELIAENIRFLVENPEKRKEIGRKGFEFYQKYHSPQAVGRIFEDIYLSLWDN